MTFEIALILGILAVALVLFFFGWIRADLVSLMVMVSLAITGLLSPQDAVSGFGHPSVITVWAVLILSGGLTRTGVAGLLGRQLLRLAGKSEGRLIIMIMLTAAALSAFMNNIAVAALLLPVVMDIARRTGLAPSKLLIPLAFSSLLGGVMTLIGTPANILAAGALEEQGLKPFEFFDFAPVGAAVVVAGIAYMSFVGRRILPERNAAREMAGDEEDLDQAYSLDAGLFAVDIPAGSPLVGMSLAESRLGAALALNVLAIQRGDALELAPRPRVRFEAGDRVFVEGPQDVMEEFGVSEYLTLSDDRVPFEEWNAEGYDLVEVTVSASSKYVGKTPRDLDLRARYGGVIVLAVRRGETCVRDRLAETALESDDGLLILAPHGALVTLAEEEGLEVHTDADLAPYSLEERMMSLRVAEGSPLVGKSLGESRLGDVFSLGVMTIVREGEKIFLPSRTEVLCPRDLLWVKGRRDDFASLIGLHELPVAAESAATTEILESKEIGFGEVVLTPRSRAAGKTLSEVHFRERHGLNVVAVMRGGVAHRNLRYLELAFGDALLVHGARKRLQLLAEDADYLVLRGGMRQRTTPGKASLAAAIMAGVVGSVIFGLLPVFVAAVTGAILMILTRCLTMDEAYRSIEWRAVFLIAGLLPLGLAMQQTGAADWIAGEWVGVIGHSGPRTVVAGFYLLTALAAQMMPAAAVAILVAPLAITTALELGLSPYALVMTVSISASASFMSPVSHPANVLIMGPGGYRRRDYIFVGLPLTLVCLLVTVWVLPLVWSLVP